MHGMILFFVKMRTEPPRCESWASVQELWVSFPWMEPSFSCSDGHGIQSLPPAWQALALPQTPVSLRV